MSDEGKLYGNARLRKTTLDELNALKHKIELAASRWSWNEASNRNNVEKAFPVTVPDPRWGTWSNDTVIKLGIDLINFYLAKVKPKKKQKS